MDLLEDRKKIEELFSYSEIPINETQCAGGTFGGEGFWGIVSQLSIVGNVFGEWEREYKDSISMYLHLMAEPSYIIL